MGLHLAGGGQGGPYSSPGLIIKSYQELVLQEGRALASGEVFPQLPTLAQPTAPLVPFLGLSLGARGVPLVPVSL